MARSSKWIEGVKPDHPISAVASRAIRERLKTVWHYAPLAAKRSEEDVEHVHQLRVATRRARAALQLFSDLLPPRETRRMKRQLRELRRAAGEARDLDVLAARLQLIAQTQHGSCLGPTVEQVLARRRTAQAPLKGGYKRAKRKRFKQRSRDFCKAIRWRQDEPEPTFAVAARARLAPVVDVFLTAAAADLADIENLHQMRIAGKQVRYAMELLASAFEASLHGELYEIFAEVQDKLGAINDHATAITMFSAWQACTDSSSGKAELADLIASEHAELAAKCQEFREWWTTQRQQKLAGQFARLLQTAPAPIVENVPEPGEAAHSLEAEAGVG